jgi:8-oxo-dGTP diphosphatase
MAAGGIVVRDAAQPLIGIVRLRKDKSWVLPKGKLKPGESALDAAKREVEEETGHDVTVLGFLGSMSHATNGRQKVVQFWHMRAESAPVRALMRDVKAVKWLPLSLAIDALTRPHEKAFLSNVGPGALHAALGAAPARVARNTLIGSIRAWLRRMTHQTTRG